MLAVLEEFALAAGKRVLNKRKHGQFLIGAPSARSKELLLLVGYGSQS